jgi:hypothetical protein
MLLGWIALMLFAADPPASRRRHIRRYGFFDLARMRGLVRNLIIIRAGQLVPRRAASRRCFGNAASGVRQRTRPRCLYRAAAGARLRRRLRARGGQAAVIAHLLAVLADIDALAAGVARRFRRRLTRLFPLVAVRPPHEAASSLAAPAPWFADSS